jgi:hypothetical protein
MELDGLGRLRNMIDAYSQSESEEFCIGDNKEQIDWEKRKWTEGTYINCDLRYYNLASLGKFDVVVVDPPW